MAGAKHPPLHFESHQDYMCEIEMQSSMQIPTCPPWPSPHVHLSPASANPAD